MVRPREATSASLAIVKQVSLIGLGNLSPALLVPEAFDHLKRASLLIADASTTREDLAPLLNQLEIQHQPMLKRGVCCLRRRKTGPALCGCEKAKALAVRSRFVMHER
jgi:hypothetical protein